MKQWYETYAEKNNVKIGDGAKDILAGLDHNKQKMGARYCPCSLAHCKETICPCLTMRTTKECHCGLFVK